MASRRNNRRCQAESPVNGWQCNKSRHYGDPNHRARDPKADPPKLDGCIITDWPEATVEEWTEQIR